MLRTTLFAGFILLGGCAADRTLEPMTSPLASAAAAAMETVRDLEERERRAVLMRDIPAIESFWDPELLVNAPNNRLLIGRDATLDLVKRGIIDFHRFDRTVERVEVAGAVAVAMGSETVVQKRGPQAGQVIERRYTNVWQRKNGKWQLRFRHANLVPSQPQLLDPPKQQ